MSNCGIYMIKNNINGKIYIGKSKDIQERWGEHKRQSLCSDFQWNNNQRGCQTPIHKAIRKYGIENFTFKIIEILSPDDNNNLNNREKYWIKYYNTFKDKNKGYNLTPGGDGFDFGKGEKSITAKLTQKNVDFIKQKLREGWSAKQIQAELPVSVGNSTISAINTGQNWRVEGEKYPISRNNGNKKFNNEQVKEIREKYQNGSKIKDLAKEYKVSLETMKNLIYYKTYKEV